MTTTGVIIAAGAGTRLADATNIPKPLRTVLGVPLLKRIIMSAYKGGLTRIVVVVGFQKEKIISYIQNESWPITVEWVENPDWKKSNGVSVLAAKSVVHEDFILLMSDHIFDFSTLAKLRMVELNRHRALLAVDLKIHHVFDKDDATKVQVENGLITEINKNLVKYNAIDTGMFLMSPEIFTALEASLKDGDCSLSDGVRLLAGRAEMGVFDIGEAYWQDVDTKDALKHAEKVLLNSCRKSTDGFISRNFNRHVSLFISSFVAKTPVSANQLTIVFLVIGLLSGYLASFGDYTSYLWAAFLFKLTSILDGVDGEISKLKFTASKFGQWLDTISDNLTYVAFTIGTAVGLYRVSDPWINFLGPAACFGLAALLFVMFFYIIRYSDSGSLLAVQNDFKNRDDVSLPVKMLLKLYFLIKRDFFATFFLLLAVFGKANWILLLLAFATNVAWMVIVWTKFIQPRFKISK